MAGISLSGLASGLDTATMVDQLMAIEARGKTRLQLRQSATASQQAQLRDLKTKLDALKAAAADLRGSATWAEVQTAESSDPARVAVAKTGGAPIGGYTVKVTQLAASAQKTYGWTESTSATTLNFDTDGPGGTAAIAVGIAANAKIGDVAATINGRSDLPVYAAVVGGDKLVLSSRVTGAAADFTVDGSAQLSGPTNPVAGRNAEYYLNDVLVVPPSASNVVEDAIPGVRLTFKGITTDPASIVVGAPAVDREKVKGEVKAFVEAYNALVTATRAKLDEKSVKNAATATDFAKGQFFGDTGLTSMLSKLRIAMGEKYSAETAGTTRDELSEIGLTTGKPGTSIVQAKTGQLVLDEAKLMEALEGDAQSVRKLFGGTSTEAFAQDLEKLAGDLSKALDSRLSSTETQSKRITDELSRADTRLASKEKRYRAQFAAMEAALNASQTQSSWLTSQLASLSNSG